MKPLLSLVVPVLNEEDVLDTFIARLSHVLHQMSDQLEYEIIFIDDGSSDSSCRIISEASQKDSHIKLLSFSRNFGHQAALAAGFDHSSGDAVVTIDCDLQDPPEVITEMVQRWKEGYDIVLAKRRSREGETRKKLVTAHLFYRFLSRISDTELSEDVADFRLLSREVVETLRELRETNPYYRGLVNWVGFKRAEIEYDRHARFAGETKYTLKKMVRLAINGITSFSDKPLQLVSLLGLSFMFISSFGGILLILAKTLDPQRSVAGYISMLLVTLFLGGLQLFSIGTLGIYLSVLNQNSKARPRYVLAKKKCIGI